MSGQAAMMPLLMLVSCSIPPQAQQEVVLPAVVVEEKQEPKEPPKPQPKTETKQADKSKGKADTRCPPVEGETEQQRILRKLDCIIEKD